MDIELPPSFKFMKSLQKHKRRELRNAWLNDLPEYWLEDFMNEGVLPFLKKFGYTLGFSEEMRVKYCRAWAYAYVHSSDVECIQWAHEGGDEEYEWYRNTISEDTWNLFAKEWCAIEFLDDSDTGLKQLSDLSWFVWHCISLENSLCHIRWQQMIDDEEVQEDYLMNDDSYAYGGDRRTY